MFNSKYSLDKIVGICHKHTEKIAKIIFISTFVSAFISFVFPIFAMISLGSCLVVGSFMAEVERTYEVKKQNKLKNLFK